MKLRTAVRIAEVTVMAGAVAFTYVVLLTPGAKQQLRVTASALVKRFGEIQGKIEEMQGLDMEEDLAETNRREAERQWESIGY